jgi:hypothetical protein
MDVQIHVFLTSAKDRGKWPASRPGGFLPGEKAPGTRWTGGLVGPRTDTDNVERKKKSCPTGTHTPTPRPFGP